MINRITHKMLRHEVFLTLASLVSFSIAIRVDFNTNKGPIIPPTSTLPPIPKPPFREPAPAWEDQSDDIPNPNPYQYVLPPPSRPKPLTDNFARSPIPAQQRDQYQQRSPNYGQIISKPFNDNYNTVPSLAIQYVPNVGFKYHAVVPSQTKYSKDNNVYDKYNKLNGKYNPKLKKFKAYEKTKYVPYIYYVTAPQQQTYVQQQLYPTQQTFQQPQPTYTTQQTYSTQPTYATQQITSTEQSEQKSYDKQFQNHKSASSKQESSKQSYNSPNSLTGNHFKSRR